MPDRRSGNRPHRVVYRPCSGAWYHVPRRSRPIRMEYVEVKIRSMTKTLLSAALLAACCTPARAQAPGGPPAGRGAPAGAPAARQAEGVIHGTVRDGAGGAPLSGASIAVRRSADSVLVTGGVSKA